MTVFILGNDNRCVRKLRARWSIRGKILWFRLDGCVTLEILYIYIYIYIISVHVYHYITCIFIR